MLKRLAVLYSVILFAPFAWAAPASAAVHAIVDVNVVPMDRERVIASQTVVIRDGRIAEMGPSDRVRVPQDAQRIDGRGRYLMPGLAEMHAHIPPRPRNEQEALDVLFLYAANGITFARGMLGAPQHLQLRERAARGEIVSPRIYTSGPSLNGNSVASPAAGRAMVAEQKRAGYDFLKIHPGLDRARFDAIVEAARQHGIDFAGHVSYLYGLPRALEAGQVTVDHLDEYMRPLLHDGSRLANEAPVFFGINLVADVDDAKIVPVARRTRDAGVWNVPTQSFIEHLALPEPDAEALGRRPEMQYLPPATVRQWVQRKKEFVADAGYDPEVAKRFVDIRRKLIKALHDEGAGLLLGSDAPQLFNAPGFSMHHELRMLVDAGLTPYQALATGNVNVAKFLGEENEFGTVATGKRADLILLEANPLESVANVQKRAGVMLNGSWLPEADIQAELKRIAARAARN
ncbi:MAG TPA: amidohydrolase family protein [Burkholderiales bacterium]|nr:amidohydrolase family protein [Burkholderiales bacterium]